MNTVVFVILVDIVVKKTITLKFALLSTFYINLAKINTLSDKYQLLQKFPDVRTDASIVNTASLFFKQTFMT